VSGALLTADLPFRTVGITRGIIHLMDQQSHD